jgi:hypothetical protein
VRHDRRRPANTAGGPPSAPRPPPAEWATTPPSSSGAAVRRLAPACRSYATLPALRPLARRACCRRCRPWATWTSAMGGTGRVAARRGMACPAALVPRWSWRQPRWRCCAGPNPRCGAAPSGYRTAGVRSRHLRRAAAFGPGPGWPPAPAPPPWRPLADWTGLWPQAASSAAAALAHIGAGAVFNLGNTSWVKRRRHAGHADHRQRAGVPELSHKRAGASAPPMRARRRRRSGVTARPRVQETAKDQAQRALASRPRRRVRRTSVTQRLPN